METITKTLTIFAFLFSFNGDSLWQRHVRCGKGNSFDTPRPQSLAYFIDDPFLGDDGDQFCSVCTPKGKSSVHLQYKFTTETHNVGALHGFEIDDVYYRFDEHAGTSTIEWKSILVKVGPDRFRERYHLQHTEAKIAPSYLLKAGGEQILATRDVIPGTGNYYYEDYFWFSAAGPKRIDIEKIAKVVEAILPSGHGVWKGGGLNMAALTYHSPVWKSGDANCCPSGGTVFVRVSLDGNRSLVASKSYNPAGKVFIEYSRVSLRDVRLFSVFSALDL